MIRRTALLGLTALALASAGCGPAESPARPAVKEIGFSVLSADLSAEQEALWKEFLGDMEKETGLKVTPFYASNYTSLVQAMRFDQAQVGRFSTPSALQAVRQAGGEVFVRATDPSGADAFASILVVAADGGLTLDDVTACGKGLTFGLGDPKSTSGAIAPMTYLFGPKGIDPRTCFRTVRSANHEANLRSVADGVLDAAVASSEALVQFREDRPAEAARLKVVWSSPPLPEEPFVWRKDLDPATKEKIRSFFLTYGAGEGPEAERQRRVLRELSFGPFRPADDTHLLPAREMEAAEALYAARASGDADAIARAEKAVAAVARERAEIEARTAEAPADAPAAG